MKAENPLEKKIFKVSSVSGDYATLIEEASREELFIALALLPIGTDIGTRLEYENFEFTII